MTNIFQSSDAYESARKGTLPPGVRQKSWVGDNNIAYAMAVYLPSASARAAAAAKEMSEAVLVGEDRLSRNGSEKAKVAAKGPSGKVSKDNDL